MKTEKREKIGSVNIREKEKTFFQREGSDLRRSRRSRGGERGNQWESDQKRERGSEVA